MGRIAYATRNVPVIGKWIGRVNKVADIMAMPCDLDPTIVVYAFWNATPHLLWSLFKPDTNDLVTARVGLAHRRKKQKRYNFLEDMVAEFPHPKGFGAAIFKLGSVAERLGWYMLVADATTDFAVHWTSTAYQWAGCRTPGAPYCTSKGPPGPYGDPVGGRYLLGSWQVEREVVFAGDGESIATPGGYNSSAMVSMVLSDPGYPYPMVSGFRASLVDTVTGNILDTAFTGGEGRDDGNMIVDLAFRAWETLTLPHRFAVELEVGPGYYNWEKSSFRAYGNKDGGMLSDP